MDIRRIIIWGAVFFAGCATSTANHIRAIQKEYAAINFADGVSPEEAALIAQNQLIAENLVQLYEISRPRLEKDLARIPQSEKYWLVSFDEKGMKSFKFIFMTAIDKKSGMVKFADDFSRDKMWILEAALLR